MSPLLFDAFLRTLENDGLRTDVRDQARLQVAFSAQRDWSVAAVRDTLRVLLTRDAGERAAFDRSFDAFFRQSLQCDRGPRIDVTDLLAQLRSRPPDEAPASAPPAAGPAVTVRRRSGPEAEREDGWSAWRRRIAQPFRRLAERVQAIVHRVRDWLDDRRESHRPQEPPPPAEETIPWQVNVDQQTFSFAWVGAPLEPLLTGRQIKRLADMLGFFRTDLAGRRLDVPATVRTAVRAGDPGRMCFQPLAATRHVLVLEDALAQREFRTSLADELCAGFEATGVTVERGRFRHAVDRWTNRRGAEVDLGDLEAEREGYVVLVFTDGSSFGRPGARQSLERLAQWPRAAWLDWREPRWRIAARDVPQAAGMLPFSATPEGLLAAFTSFLMQGRRRDESDAADPLVADLAESQMGLDRYVDAVLDDAFLWAADCSLLQPCSLPLAERLRRRFHPAVPRIALQRVLRLPGVCWDAAGIAFAPPTQAVLRRGWLARRPGKQQETVLRFVEGQLQAVRPTAAPEGSLAQLLWTAGVERVRLELDPDNDDLLRFAQVLHSPAGRWLLSSLAGYFAPGCAANPDQVVPLRVAPRAEHARGRLALAVAGANEEVRPTPPPPRPLEIVWIEPGEFPMGSPESEAGRFDNERQHRVRITRRFGIGKDPVTQSQYAELMGTNPSHFQHAGPDAPVEQVSWEDAMEFCRRRTERDRELGTLPEGYEYTLPTEAQWEYACRAGTGQATYAGDLRILGQCNAPMLDPIAWYGGNSGVEYEGGIDSSDWPEKQYDHQHAGTHPVGLKQPNAAGLYDMLGNVWEWCVDWYGDYGEGDAVDPWGPDEGSARVVRGGAWNYNAQGCRSACRFRLDPGLRLRYLGFRVAAVQSAELQAREREGRPRARELVWLEPGEFLMGSPKNEAGRFGNEQQHPVRITWRFALGKEPVTQAQYEEVMGTNPSYFQHAGQDAPVEQVSWDEAIEYCRRLTELDRQSGTLPEGYEYTLPTEAQWEYACRAGTGQATYAGDLRILGQRNAPVLDPIAWYGGNSGVEYEGGVDSSKWPEKQYDHPRAGTHPVGQKQPNAAGLHDMLGNVWEWCADWFGDYGGGDAVDPWGPDEGSNRVVRGGAWDSTRGSAAPRAATGTFLAGGPSTSAFVWPQSSPLSCKHASGRDDRERAS